MAGVQDRQRSDNAAWISWDEPPAACSLQAASATKLAALFETTFAAMFATTSERQGESP
jgi:hypothetical protein